MTQIHAIALHTKLFTLVLDPTLILIFISFECWLNLNMRVKFKGGLNCQLPTAIRVKSKCGLTSRAGKMHVITVIENWNLIILCLCIYLEIQRIIHHIELGYTGVMEPWDMLDKWSDVWKKAGERLFAKTDMSYMKGIGTKA